MLAVGTCADRDVKTAREQESPYKREGVVTAFRIRLRGQGRKRRTRIDQMTARGGFQPRGQREIIKHGKTTHPGEKNGGSERSPFCLRGAQT